MTNKKNNYPIFSLGFRAFFALAGLFALVLIALWRSIYDGSLSIDNYYPINLWHGHEMLMGYSVAVISGFLLTAVKNWTGIQTLQGNKLLGLCMLWVYGRIVPFYSGLLPDSLIALIDFSFVPVLTYFVAKPILQSGNYKNLLFIALLLVVALCNGLIHAEVLGYTENTAATGIDLIVAIIILLILIIAGRVFPFFTERGLKGVMAIRNPILDWLAIMSSALVFLLFVFNSQSYLLTLVAIFATLVNIIRVAGWYNHKVWYVPLLWVLYIGYAWIMLGFVLVALASVSLVPASLATHAFTVGGMGVLTLGMMARVSLGHTGRALKVSNMIAIAFVIINLAALCRVILPAFFSDGYAVFLLISSYCWLAAFSLFIYIYWPVLSSVRIDGKAG